MSIDQKVDEKIDEIALEVKKVDDLLHSIVLNLGPTYSSNSIFYSLDLIQEYLNELRIKQILWKSAHLDSLFYRLKSVKKPTYAIQLLKKIDDYAQCLELLEFENEQSSDS